MSRSSMIKPVIAALIFGTLVIARVASASEVAALPLAAPQIDASTRALAQESLLSAMQASLGDLMEPGDLKKRLGSHVREALDCSDSECWMKVGAKARVPYVFSARGVNRDGGFWVTVALVRTSDGKIVGRACQPLVVADPAGLAASSEYIVRRLRESTTTTAPELSGTTVAASR